MGLDGVISQWSVLLSAARLPVTSYQYNHVGDISTHLTTGMLPSFPNNILNLLDYCLSSLLAISSFDLQLITRNL
jgi:hypothetical protein